MQLPPQPATASRGLPLVRGTVEPAVRATAATAADPVLTATITDFPLVAATLEGIVVTSDSHFASSTEHLVSTLLLKDGRARLGLEGSPLELAPPPEDAEPDAFWTRWREAVDDAGGYEILDAATAVWTRLTGTLFRPKVDPSAEEMSGRHERTRTETLGTTSSTVTERLELAVDGSFSRSRSVFAMVAAPGFDRAGVPSVLHLRETASDPARLGGTWALLEDGFTLELIDADGDRERVVLLDDGGTRIVDHRRHVFASEDIATIDLLGLVERWATGRQGVGNDWRAVLAEASARVVEQRSTRARPVEPPAHRVRADPPPETLG